MEFEVPFPERRLKKPTREGPGESNSPEDDDTTSTTAEEIADEVAVAVAEEDAGTLLDMGH